VAQLARQPFVVSRWPDIGSTLELLGGHQWHEIKTLLEVGQLPQAEALTSEALRLAPHSVTLLAYQGQLALMRGHDPTPWLERSLAGYPKLALPALLSSQYLLRQGRPLAAIETLQASVRERAYDETSRYVLGNSMLEHLPPEQTVAFFAAQVSGEEKPQTSHYFVGLGHQKLGNEAAAINAWRSALEIDPAHELSQRAWGLVLEQQGQLVPALEHLVEATRIHPEFRAALADVARLAERLGHPTEAAAWRERALRANPDTPRRFVYWARYLHGRGRGPAALSELARRLTEAPDDVEALGLQREILQGAHSPPASGVPGAAPEQPAFVTANATSVVTKSPYVPEASD
jgi:tetratricopeptide (TPR) repeat protein